MNKKSSIIIIGVILVACIVVFLIYKSIFPIDIFIMQGTSMEPTIISGEKVALDKINKDYKQKDIVVINIPGKSAQTIKRIIGLPGQAIEIRGGRVFVDNVELNETYVKGETKKDFKVVLENNKYFVLGDNREQSFDSRAFGGISLQDIIGKIVYEDGKEFVPRKIK